MWLRDALPNDLAGARVIIYGHDSQLHDSNSFQDFKALGQSFCTHLESIRCRVCLRLFLSCVLSR